jgi:hypothetical protein
LYRPDAYGSQIIGSGATEVCIDNMALIVLDRALPPAPAPLRLERAMTLGEQVVAVGHKSHPGSGPYIVNAPEVERTATTDLHVIAVGPDREREESGPQIPRTFITEDSESTLRWPGASAFSADTGAVVGIYVGAPSHAVIKIAPYASLLDDAFASAGADPIPEDDAIELGGSTRHPSCALARGAEDGPAVAALSGIGWCLVLLRKRGRASC